MFKPRPSIQLCTFRILLKWRERGASVAWQRCDSGTAVGRQLVQPKKI
jgi:hypothetical protein